MSQQGQFTAEPEEPPSLALAPKMRAAACLPTLRRLGPEQMDMFFEKHTQRRLNATEAERPFMKVLKRELLDKLMEQGMPVIGVFIGGELVSGCAVLYPADKYIRDYLSDYNFDDISRTAVISALWTDKNHERKGLSKEVVNLAMDIAIMEGKDIFCAKVDRDNTGSIGTFSKLGYDTTRLGQNPQKFYPRWGQ